ncbi:mechanosensitive ion channel family protein [Spirochaeta dissipatitropha]
MNGALKQISGLLQTRISMGNIEFGFTPMQIVLELLLPLAILILSARLFHRMLRRGRKNWRFSESIEDAVWERFSRTIHRIVRIFILLMAVVLVGRLLGAQIIATFTEIGKILTQPIIESGSTRISITTMLLVMPVLYVAGRIGLAVKQYSRKSFLAKLDAESQSTLSDLLRYGTASVIAIVGISMIGINLSSLAVLFGVLGIGIGFGLQEVVSNVFSGLVIILARPIKEGDRVLVNQNEGNVVNIRLMNTVINTLTNETIIVPNSALLNKEVYNFSYDSPSIILVNRVQVSYRSDLDKVLEVLKTIPGNNPYAMEDRVHQAFVKSFDDSGITVELRTWIRTVYDKMAAHSWVNLEIWRSFREAGIEIPFPQMDVHLSTGEG